MRGREDKPVMMRVAGVIGGLLLWVVSLGGGVFLGWSERSPVFGSLAHNIIFNEPPEKAFAADMAGSRDYLNVLILGCDEDRYYAGRGHKNPGAVLRHASRSDMMLVARIDFGKKRITGISIPRDLAWTVPGYKQQKINAFHNIGYNEGGPERGKELAKEAAEGVLGLSIDKVVVLNFEAFKQMVDMLGGVEVFVPRNMNYDDNAGDLHIHLKKGRQVLSGYNAMCYVRYRHGDSDFKRQDRQKELMMALKDKALHKWASAPELINKSMELMGNAFNSDQMASLMLFGKAVGADNIKMDMVPVVEVPGSTFLELDTEKLSEKLKELHMKEPGAYSVSSRS
ncbi:MAG: LCP family protein [Armatimonadetes bacterium]|nr:LCP family protein [Armatimonadota bacterium]